MLKSLKYEVTFPATGRSLKQKINFREGFGAIVGPNESGKSMIIEMIRYALFGVAALRGTSSDYKDLSVTLSWITKGDTYTVERTMASAELFRGKDQIAVGTRPVNAKVPQVLGFGLDVFDVACVANQGDIEKLGDMRPAERKRMVDSVIGLGVIEDLAKFCGDEATALRRRAEDLKASLVKPVAPVQPEGYEPSALLVDRITELTAAKTEFDQLAGWLSQTRKEPIEPTCEIEESVVELEAGVENVRKLDTTIEILKTKLADIPAVGGYSADQLDDIALAHDAYELGQAKKQFLTRNPMPSLTAVQLADHRLAFERWEKGQRAKHVQTAIDQLKAKGEHVCPACDHRWPVEGTTISGLEAELEALAEFIEAPKPAMSMTDIEREERLLTAWEAVADEWVQLKDADLEARKPNISRKELETFRLALSREGERKDLERELEAQRQVRCRLPPYQEMLRIRQQFEHELAHYQTEKSAYESWQAEHATKLARYRDLEPEVAKLPGLLEAYQSALVYERELDAFCNSEDAYAQGMDTVDGFLEEAEAWASGRAAMTGLRGAVKQYLVPSLNRVASHYLNQMTGGQRQVIKVNEEFDILVDNQPLNTLSGSGKAVANLALRLGLGQVLTNGVFSLFMGDEIDASMDKDRAENTAVVLRTLNDRLSQILLVTHKYPVADYYIDLGNESDQQLATD